MKIIGIVIKGKEEGRKLGFPTANIVLSHKGEVKSGVYKGKAHLEEKPPSGPLAPKTYIAAIFVHREEEILEAHILDFEGDLYGKEIEVEIKEKIRDTVPYTDDDRMKQQIEKDIQNIKSAFL